MFPQHLYYCLNTFSLRLSCVIAPEERKWNPKQYFSNWGPQTRSTSITGDFFRKVRSQSHPPARWLKFWGWVLAASGQARHVTLVHGHICEHCLMSSSLLCCFFSGILLQGKLFTWEKWVVNFYALPLWKCLYSFIDGVPGFQPPYHFLSKPLKYHLLVFQYPAWRQGRLGFHVILSFLFFLWF